MAREPLRCSRAKELLDECNKLSFTDFAGTVFVERREDYIEILLEFWWKGPVIILDSLFGCFLSKSTRVVNVVVVPHLIDGSLDHLVLGRNINIIIFIK